MFKFQKFTHPIFGSNSYVIYEEKNCIIIDPTDISSKHIINFIESNKLKPICIINTHGHFDHISGDDILRNYFNIPLYIHKEDEVMLSNPELNFSSFIGKPIIIKPPDNYLDENDEIMSFKILHMPGHTPGSICLKYENLIIVGDLVFTNSIGRIDLPLSNVKKMKESLKRFLEIIDEKTTILSGHGKIFNLQELKKDNEILWSFLNS
ncbi:MAG: MBL fold metallo-hydrolase [candidate division WOR-3 bacterium]